MVPLTTGPAGHILSLPREIRDEIYAPLLKEGSIAILRTCKQIHEEAMEHLFHLATYRIHVFFPGGDTFLDLPRKFKDIQRFHVRIYLGAGTRMTKLATCGGLFESIGGVNGGRKCKVSLEYDLPPNEYFQPMYPSTLVRKFRLLETFRKVVVEFVPNREEPMRRRITQSVAFPDGVWDSNKQNEDTIKYVAGLLEGKLGPGVCHALKVRLPDGGEGTVLLASVFHPQQNRR